MTCSKPIFFIYIWTLYNFFKYDINNRMPPTDIYGVFNSNQIKSATDNIGTYSEADDIRYNKTKNLDYTKEQQSLALRSKINATQKEETSKLKEHLDSIKNDRKIFTPEERESMINTLYVQMQIEALEEYDNNEVKAKEAITKDFDEYFNRALLRFGEFNLQMQLNSD